MTAPVDVLAVLERARADLQARGQATVNEKAAIAAIRELIDYSESAVEYVAKCADAVDVNHRMAGRPNSLNVARTVEANLREAISLVKGGV